MDEREPGLRTAGATTGQLEVGRWQIEPDVDDRAAYAVLAEDRAWNGYSIADLVPPFRTYTQVALARRDAAPPSAACLFLRHPAFKAIVPHGDAAGLAAILAAVDLPQTAYLLARPPHLPPIERHYTFPKGREEMLRMIVTARTFRPPDGKIAAVERLTPDDLPALLDLYASYGANAFNADQLTHGLFYGVRDGEAIVAAGGTHAVAAPYRIAAVGNIFTRPDARGRGYASTITAAVVGDLLGGPCDDVILNVAAANEVAVRMYARLGFREHCRYWEAQMVRRQTGEES